MLYNICTYSGMAFMLYLVLYKHNLLITKILGLGCILYMVALPFLFLYAYLKSKYDEKYHGAVFDKNSGTKIWFAIITISLWLLNHFARGGKEQTIKLIDDIIRGLSL